MLFIGIIDIEKEFLGKYQKKYTWKWWYYVIVNEQKFYCQASRDITLSKSRIAKNSSWHNP